MFPNTCLLLQKLLYMLPPTPPRHLLYSSLRVTWDAASQDWNPKNVHQTKHNQKKKKKNK